MLTARDAVRGEGAAEALRDESLEGLFKQLEMTDGRSVEGCARRLSDAGTDIDVLVNNAGVYPTEGVFQVDEETFRRALEINTLGPFRTCRAFVPGVRAGRSCRRWCGAATAGWSTSQAAAAPSVRE